jgi:hypothetical protein
MQVANWSPECYVYQNKANLFHLWMDENRPLYMHIWNTFNKSSINSFCGFVNIKIKKTNEIH